MVIRQEVIAIAPHAHQIPGEIELIYIRPVVL
jgi:hypothetical protein